jgi:hypothetical protein
MATVIVAALLPFTTCLFQESYAFFLGAIEKFYNKDPPLSISLKEFPFTSHLVPVILYNIPPLPPGSKIATAVPFRTFFLDKLPRGIYNHGPLLSIHWKKNSPYLHGLPVMS